MGGPFVPWVPLREPLSQAGFGAVAGELAGLRLAVKDLFDVAGLPTGAGNPRWLETHPIPANDAPAVARLLRAGASLVGKTVTDELAWSLNGTNIHYGTPYNPAAPGRMPGGSSSGSAAAVAAALADIGLGTDTGGSIRVPASYCGLYGLRPTHARVPREGVVPLAATFDVAGLLCRDAVTLRKSAAALLDPPDEDRPERQPRITRLLVPRDVWEQVPEATAAALRARLGSNVAASTSPWCNCSSVAAESSIRSNN
jgi:amidase